MRMESQIQVDRDEFGPSKLYHVRLMRLGIAHLLFGFLTLMVGIFDVTFSAVAFDIFPLAKVATGIWVGVTIIATGAVGVVTSRSELRRKTVNRFFLVLSLISGILALFMIAVGISEIALSEYAEGEINVQKRFLNISDCLNITNQDPTLVRCIAKTTFDQKVVSGSLLVIVGYVSSLIAFYAVIVTRDIMKQYALTLNSNTSFRMTEREGALPGMSVSDYFDARMQQENEHSAESSSIPRHVRLNGPQKSLSLTSETVTIQKQENANENLSENRSQDFPDSEQFRSHLEILTGQTTCSKDN